MVKCSLARLLKDFRNYRKKYLGIPNIIECLFDLVEKKEKSYVELVVLTKDVLKDTPTSSANCLVFEGYIFA